VAGAGAGAGAAAGEGAGAGAGAYGVREKSRNCRKKIVNNMSTIKYLTSMKHFISKAATSKHYCCNMCSIGAYNMAVELSSITTKILLQHLQKTTATSRKYYCNIYYGCKKNTIATSTKYYCNIFYLRLQHLNILLQHVLKT
jgi:hypothetical protein